MDWKAPMSLGEWDGRNAKSFQNDRWIQWMALGKTNLCVRLASAVWFRKLLWVFGLMRTVFFKVALLVSPQTVNFEGYRLTYFEMGLTSGCLPRPRSVASVRLWTSSCFKSYSGLRSFGGAVLVISGCDFQWWLLQVAIALGMLCGSIWMFFSEKNCSNMYLQPEWSKTNNRFGQEVMGA